MSAKFAYRFKTFIMKSLCVLSLLLIVSVNLNAQVGIGTITPSAQLDIKSSNQSSPINTDGILIPKIDDFPLTAPTASQDGMMVFVTGGGTPARGFYYWDNGTTNWILLNGGTGTSEWQDDGPDLSPIAGATKDITIGGANNTASKLTVRSDKSITGLFTNTTTQDTYMWGVNTYLNNSSIDINTQTRGNYNDILTAAGTAYGDYNNVRGTGDGTHYGELNTLSGAGTGNHYGVSSILSGTGSGTHYGAYNSISNTGSGDHTGISNSLSGSGSGSQIGVRNNINNTGNSLHTGIWNSMDGSGSGPHLGVYNSLGGAGTGVQTGMSNYITNSGNNSHFGISNTLSGSGFGVHVAVNNTLSGEGLGTHKGMYNYFSGASAGNHIGVDTELSGTGNGSHTGITNTLNGVGNGQHYAIRNYLSGSGNGLQIGVYNSLINTGSGNHTGVYTSITGAGIGDREGHSIALTGNGEGDHRGISLTIDSSGNGEKIGNDFLVQGIGTGDFYGNRIKVGGSTATSGDMFGSYHHILSQGNGEHYGIYNRIDGYGSGVHSAVYNYIGGTGSNIQYGLQQVLQNSGGSMNIGVHNLISGEGTGTHKGVENILSGLGSGDQIGIENTISNSLDGQHTTIKNTIDNTGTGAHTSIDNYLSGSGSGIQRGINNYIDNSGNNFHIAVQNTILGSGNGDHFGFHNSMSGTGSGNKFGVYSTITSTSGGQHFGVYSSALKSGSFAGYFLGNVAIGTIDANKYVLPPSRGSIGQVMQTDGSGNVTWSNVVVDEISDVDNDTKIQVEENANENIIRFDTAGLERMIIDNTGKVGVNTAIPLDQMDITGILRLTTTSNNAAQLRNDDNFNHQSDNNIDFGDEVDAWMVSSRENTNENSGIYGDRDFVTVWAPADSGRIIRFLDEDAWGDNDGNPYNNAAELAYIDNAGQFVQASDKNRKQHISKISDGLQKLIKLQGYTYEYKLSASEKQKGGIPQRTSGVLAQELYEVLPEAVQVSEHGEYFVHYAGIIPLLIEAIKEQQDQIETLQNDNLKLKQFDERLKRIEKELND